MRRALIFRFVAVQDLLVGLLHRNLTVHRALFAPGLENYRWVVGRWRAWRTFDRSRRNVPAYGEYLQAVAPEADVRLRGWQVDLAGLPEMDKTSYIKAFSTQQRCVNGVIPRRGVVADESSGSSGTPTNWVRGREERKAVRLILQATFSHFVGDKPTFVLNAFSLGAWATGLNVSTSLADVCIIKSTGPDMTKIIDTMTSFGPGYSYVVMGYPPFLKNLADDPRSRLSDYDVIACFGGEGLSENMRRYLLRSFREVVGSYGASDLEINMAAENAFTIALRQELEHNEALRRALTNVEYGVLPMIFQYNPFNYVIETNPVGELIVTICRRQNLSPRIRYNIHDRGHVLRMRDLVPVLDRHGLTSLLEQRVLDLPLLFHYGRSDLSVDYYGATVAPDSVREFIYGDPDLARDVSTYRVISYEDHDTNKQLLFALELKAGVTAGAYAEDEVQAQLLHHLCTVNRDFANGCKGAVPSNRPTVRLFGAATGPFEAANQKLKNEYVWHLEAPAAVEYGLVGPRAAAGAADANG